MAGHATQVLVTLHRDRHGRRSGRWAWRARWQALDGQGCPRGRPHRAPRRRQVRRRRLQGLRRPPRGRRERRERLGRLAARRDRRGRRAIWAQEYERGKPTTQVEEDWPCQWSTRGTRTEFIARSDDVRDGRVLVRHDRPAPARVGLPDEGRLDHPARPAHRTASGRSTSRAASVSFVRHLNRNKGTLHDRPIYSEQRDGSARPSRSRSSTTTRTQRTSSPSPTTSTRSTAGPTLRGSVAALTASLNDWASAEPAS